MAKTRITVFLSPTLLKWLDAVSTHRGSTRSETANALLQELCDYDQGGKKLPKRLNTTWSWNDVAARGVK